MSIQSFISPFGTTKPDRGLVRGTKPRRELEPRFVVERIGDHSRDQIILGLRRMHPDSEVERFVESSLHVRDVQSEAVKSRRIGHALVMRATRQHFKHCAEKLNALVAGQRLVGSRIHIRREMIDPVEVNAACAT